MSDNIKISTEKSRKIISRYNVSVNTTTPTVNEDDSKKNEFEFVEKIKVLLLCDIRGWAFDNIAKAFIKYNPYSDKIEYEIAYKREISDLSQINQEKYDYIYIFFEADQLIPPSKKSIRGCYSAFWIENNFFSPKKLAGIFSLCEGAVFANNFLKNSISPYLPSNYPSVVITDSSDESNFYPIQNIRNENFTVIFVGNTKRKIKNFDVIEWICKESEVDLLVCEDIKNNELVNYYNKADLCINFSDFEGGPQTFVESSLCGVPMIVRNNNELGKLIPCFRGETKEDFVSIIKSLKNDREKCKNVGIEARNIALKNFTYRVASKNFGDFIISLYNKKNGIKRDLTDKLTVFVISCGENPNYNDCIKSLRDQNVKFNIKEIKNVSPMSAAFQRMLDECNTDYYIQVDEDMILFEESIEIIYESLIKSENSISTVAYMLKDYHLDFNLYGIKGYKHKILKKYPYNTEIISCEVDQVKRLQKDGYDTVMNSKVLGYHSPKWTESLIFERYFDLMEKWKNFKYDWLGELPSKLINIFRNDPSSINFYALMGAMTSLASQEKIRDREKDFRISDENFERIKKIASIKDFKFIKNDNNQDSQILDKKYVSK